jgi:hypothetical protein
VLELAEADDDVGDLDARVVDVVLDFDRRATKPQDAYERVAERGVAKVTDMRGLVRIDRRVFDDGLVAGRRRARAVVAGALEQERAALEIKIQIAVRGRAMRSTPGIGPTADTRS